jgi:hypothetical protein
VGGVGARRRVSADAEWIRRRVAAAGAWEEEEEKAGCASV